MKIAGVIAEYNPFHLGHKYHLEKTREAGATHIAAVMSGSFVQRGDVAVFDAYSRACEAVKGGADLVLELSPEYSLGAARDFARAGISVLGRLGCIDMLSFGAETDDIEALRSALERITASELEIKSLMSSGRTYPQAAAEVCGESAAKMLSPNNTLALEYLRALEGSGIEPLAVKRTVPHDGEEENGGFASASMIRSLLKEGKSAEKFLGYSFEGEPYFAENGEKAILWRLSQMTKEDFAEVPYCGELAGRFYEASRRAASLEELYSRVKSRNVTHSRVRRAVMLAALGVREKDVAEPAFARVLALNERGAEILKACRKTAQIPLGSSLAELSRISPEAKRQAELIELGSRLQSLCGQAAEGATEYEKSARIIK